MMEVLYAVHLKDLDVSHSTFAAPDLTTFCRLDELGLVAAVESLQLVVILEQEGVVIQIIGADMAAAAQPSIQFRKQRIGNRLRHVQREWVFSSDQ